MSWITSSMSTIAMSRPSTRCSRSCAAGEAVCRAPPDDVGAEPDEDLEQLLQAHGAWLAVHERDVVDAERLLEGGQPVELLEDGLRHEPASDLDDQLEAVPAVSEVLDVADPSELLGLDQVLDPLDDLLGTHEVGQLGDDDPLAAGRDALDAGGGAGAEAPPAGEVGLPDAVQPDDPAPARQVRPRDEAHEVLEGAVRMLQQVPGGGDDLDQVVRRHVRGHADGDPARPVDQQVWEGRRQDPWLLVGVVVVGDEVDGVLVQAGDHEHRGRRHPCLGVARRSGAVVERSEVAVPVDERQAHRERLSQPDQRVVDRAVAVRVVLAHHLADDPARLHVRAVWT